MIRVDLLVPDLNEVAELTKVLRDAALRADHRGRVERAALWRRLAAAIDEGVDALAPLCNQPKE